MLIIEDISLSEDNIARRLQVLEIVEENGFKSLRSKIFIPKNHFVFQLTKKIVYLRTRTSIEVDYGKHVEDTHGQFMNHNCKPNCALIGFSMWAIRDIYPGDDLTFDYLENESFISNPFICNCCGKKIGGPEQVSDFNF